MSTLRWCSWVVLIIVLDVCLTVGFASGASVVFRGYETMQECQDGRPASILWVPTSDACSIRALNPSSPMVLSGERLPKLRPIDFKTVIDAAGGRQTCHTVGRDLAWDSAWFTEDQTQGYTLARHDCSAVGSTPSPPASSSSIMKELWVLSPNEHQSIPKRFCELERTVIEETDFCHKSSEHGDKIGQHSSQAPELEFLSFFSSQSVYNATSSHSIHVSGATVALWIIFVIVTCMFVGVLFFLVFLCRRTVAEKYVRSPFLYYEAKQHPFCRKTSRIPTRYKLIDTPLQTPKPMSAHIEMLQQIVVPIPQLPPLDLDKHDTELTTTEQMEDVYERGKLFSAKAKLEV